MPTRVSALTREHIEHFLADLFDHTKPATVAKHYRTLQRLFKFIVDDGEIPSSPMERMSPPSGPEQPVPILSHANTRVTELVYRKELRPVLSRGAVAMDALFPDDKGSPTLESIELHHPLDR